MVNKYNHIDLFTGIGGFTLACHWLGIETEVMCEKDERCRRFLERTWPGIPIIEDVRDFDGAEWKGCFLLTGGVPCQPASRAGKQRGQGDDRWLWPDTIRIIDEAKPRWCLLENPPGINDVGLEGILDELEGKGYEIGTVEIPACAVGSPQIRARYWIVGYSKECGNIGITGNSGKQDETVCRGGEGNWRMRKSTGSSQSDMAHATQSGTGQNVGGLREGLGRIGGREGSSQSDMADTGAERHQDVQFRGAFRESGESSYDATTKCHEISGNFWSNYLWTPCADGKLRRAPDDTFSLVNGLHRSVLAALGNSIVPQVAYEVIKAILAADREFA